MKKPFAKKSFGQNFLVDENYIDKIIAALNPQAGETIVEIGAGRGALTEKLIESGANILAIELERDMIAILKERFGKTGNFRLIEADALKVDFAEIISQANQKPNTENQTPKAKLVANLPYYISTAILQKLIEQRPVFSEMILMFQREVVERIAAQVGDSERGFLSVLVQNYLATEHLFDVPPKAFRPSPKVTSAVARLVPRANIPTENDGIFRRVVSLAFVQKRKTILNNLKNAPLDFSGKFGDAARLLEHCGIEPARRAETLTNDEWNCLANAICERSE
jgi:16S rRNA (adenine1518-N6/adenine1519-N6)-dimethyltransferase